MDEWSVANRDSVSRIGFSSDATDDGHACADRRSADCFILDRDGSV